MARSRALLGPRRSRRQSTRFAAIGRPACRSGPPCSNEIDDAPVSAGSTTSRSAVTTTIEQADRVRSVPVRGFLRVLAQRGPQAGFVFDDLGEKAEVFEGV